MEEKKQMKNENNFVLLDENQLIDEIKTKNLIIEGQNKTIEVLKNQLKKQKKDYNFCLGVSIFFTSILLFTTIFRWLL